MSTLGFIASVGGLVAVALLIRASPWPHRVLLVLTAVLVGSLVVLTTLRIDLAGWIALVTTTLISFVLWFGGGGDE